jgi:hypothetical protein
MPLVGSFGGNTTTKGVGGYHPGGGPVDTSGSSAEGVLGTTTVSGSLSGTIYNLSASTVSGTRITQDPFFMGAVAYSLVGGGTGTVSSVAGTAVNVSSFSGFYAGQSIYLYGYGTGSLTSTNTAAALTPGQWWVQAVVSSTQIRLSRTSGGAAVDFGTLSPAGVSWTTGLPPGFSFNASTGVITGALTINGNTNPGEKAGIINHTRPTTGANAIGTGPYNPNGIQPATYRVVVRATDNSYANNYSERYYDINLSVPFAYRQIITVGYTQAGYANSVTWNDTQRTICATDTTVLIGGGAQEVSHNYQMSAHNYTRSFTYGASGSHCGAASNIIALNMRTEVNNTSGYTRSYPVSQNNCSTLMNEFYYAWVSSPATSTVYEHNMSTETITGGVPGMSLANPLVGGNWDGYGWWGPSGQTMNFATRTNTSGRPTQGGDAQCKVLMNKQRYQYAGREGCPNSNWRRSDMTTATTSDSAPGKVYNSGEENHFTGQDWGYCIGYYGPAGHVNTSYKFVYATEANSGSTSSLDCKGGHPGNSSATASWRD